MPRFGDSGTLQDFKEWADTRAAAFGGEGRVILSFVVDTVGKVCDINIFQSPDKALSDEAIRIVASSPAWQPATEQGRCGFAIRYRSISARDNPHHPIRKVSRTEFRRST